MKWCEIMSAKYLPLKFAFVAILVLVCLGSLFYGNGLKQGQDIAGGYSMVFQVRNDEGRSDLVERIIAVLKKRIDPSGLSSLEWRPLQNDRFEVRMPAASPESQALRNSYLKAREELLATNIERSDIRALLPLNAQQRAEAIGKLTGGDKAWAKSVSRLLATMDKLRKAEASLQAAKAKIASAKSPSTNALRAMQKELLSAEAKRNAVNTEYRGLFAEVRKGNLSPHLLMSVLKIFNQANSQGDKDEKKAILAVYKQRVNELCEQYPSRDNLIRQVATLYEKWSKIRRPLEDPADLKRMIKKAGVLEFRIAPKAGAQAITDAQLQKYKTSLKTDGPEALRIEGADYAWYPVHGDGEGYGSLITATDRIGKLYILLSNKPAERMIQARGEEVRWSLASARVGSDQYGSPAVDFQFDEAGAKLFTRLTGNNVGKSMAILLDDDVYSAPNIQTVISQRGQITGRFTFEEVKELVQILEAGSLPGRVDPNPCSENSFGPAIGNENRDKAFRAAIYGLIAVAGFMLLYYLLNGAIADVALLLNIIFVLGAMSMFQAVLTLPGIAGIILTIGMAVDANVLIFERLREEQAKAQSVAQAIKNAYERAFTAIFDANITTLLICLFLFVVFDWVGMEEIRGFAITLGLGVAFSMFTALVVSRWILQTLLKLGVIKRKIPMLRLIPIFNINWMSKRYIFWAISLVMVVIGLGSLAWQGKGLLGIDFSAGTQAILKFKDDALLESKLPNDGIVRQKFLAVARAKQAAATGQLRKDLDKLIATARIETQINENIVQDFIARFDADENGKVLLADWKKLNANPAFFKALDVNGDGELAVEELEKLSQTSYQVSTTATNAPLVRDIANEAFGKNLQRRIPCKFEMVKSKAIDAMGITLASDGVTFITSETAEGVTPAYSDEIDDFLGGVLMVVQNVSPSITVNDLQRRIGDIRLLPDFGPEAVNPYKVVGLTPAAGSAGEFTSFAILARPADPDATKTKAGRTQFADGEKSVLDEALRREDAMVITSFDAAIAAETGQLAIVVVVMSWLAIVLYLWLRFGSMQWGLAAVVCLMHDVIIVIGLVAASGWICNSAIGRAIGITSFKVDLAMVAAILTVIGYSVNDTIVVFDRIRENRGKLKTVSSKCINDSINQTLPRTLLTSFTTFLVVFIMYVWGGPGIRSFNYALLMGIVFGTYSSVAVASPLLLGFKQALIAKTTPTEE